VSASRRWRPVRASASGSRRGADAAGLPDRARTAAGAKRTLTDPAHFCAEPVRRVNTSCIQRDRPEDTGRSLPAPGVGADRKGLLETATTRLAPG
jgi:hypothetical protein